MRTATDRMQDLINDSERLAEKLPNELVEVIIPVQKMLQHECQKSIEIVTPHQRARL
jgi:hypothetical protein